MPGTAVAIDLNSPLPGLGSKVSMWLGPPVIKRRMQLLSLTPDSAARAATAPSQLVAGALKTPAAVRRSRSRRERAGENMGYPRYLAACGLAAGTAAPQESMVQDEFAAIEQYPHHVGVALL